MYRRLLLFTLLLVLPSISSSAQNQSASFRFSALDENGDAYKKLQLNDVKISIGKQIVQPLGLTLDERPVDVLIMIDASASQERTLPFQRKAAETFIETVLRSGRDQVGLAKFTNNVLLVQDLSRDFALVKSKIPEIEFQPPPGYVGGGVKIVPGPLPKSDAMMIAATSMYDSLESAIKAMSHLPASTSRRAILIITDGVVTSGDKKLKDVVKVAAPAGIAVYAIGIGDDFYDGVDERTLRKLTSETGGMAVFPEKESKLAEAMRELGPAFGEQYSVTLPSPLAGDVSVEIADPQLKKRIRIIAQRVLQPK